MNTDIVMAEQMDSLYRFLREKILMNMKWFFIVFFMADFSFFWYYFLTGDVGRPVRPEIYLPVRVFTPLAINSSAYFIARTFGRKENLSEKRKDEITALALTVQLCCMSVFHSFFTILWAGPFFALIMASVFQNRRLIRGILCCNIVTIVLSAATIIAEYPEDASVYIQSAVVLLIAAPMAYRLVLLLQNYNIQFAEKFKEVFECQQNYKEKLEYDYLTGVYSKEYFTDFVTEKLEAANNKGCLSLAMIDLDNFKHINDTYGHEQGDVVLRGLGKILSELTGNVVVGRFGGEEFLVFQWGDLLDTHIERAEFVRETLEKTSYDFMDKNVTTSIGIAQAETHETLEHLIERADKAMYVSKKRRKNRITVDRLVS